MLHNLIINNSGLLELLSYHIIVMAQTVAI